MAQDPNDPTKVVYTQVGTGNNKIVVEDSEGRTAYTSVNGILIHDHTRLGSGGPAYGVYRVG